jgi:hypothetical protein
LPDNKAQLTYFDAKAAKHAEKCDHLYAIGRRGLPPTVKPAKNPVYHPIRLTLAATIPHNGR